MLTNDKATIFHLDGSGKYQKRIIPECFWYHSSALTATPSGTTTVDTARVIIPHSAEKPVVDDIVVRGAVGFLFDNSDERAQAASMKELRKIHQAYTIVSVAENKAGSRRIWHYDCSLR